MKRVLIVEDEIFTALDLEDELTSHGYEVVGIAADRKEALSLAAKADVALVDVNLRDERTGVGVGVTLARDYGVQVLFLTANPTMVGERCDGAVGCLGKPCETQSIRAAIDFAVAHEAAESAPKALHVFH